MTSSGVNIGSRTSGAKGSTVYLTGDLILLENFREMYFEVDYQNVNSEFYFIFKINIFIDF